MEDFGMNRHVCRVCAMKILFALDLNKAFDELEDLSRKIEYAMDPNFKLNESDSEIESFIVENNPFVQAKLKEPVDTGRLY